MTMTPDELAQRFGARLAADPGLRARHRDAGGSLEHTVARQRELQGRLWDEGWTGWGWPESCGGSGGTVRHRAVVYEQLVNAGIPVPEPFQILEVAGSAVVEFAPELAAELLPRALSGEEVWSLGMSEPEAGSDLASVRSRLAPTADPDRFVLNGHKIWNGLAQLSDRSFTLCRAGDTPDPRAGLTVALVDLSCPGVTRRPIKAMTGRNEYAEVFFDDVAVSTRQLVGGLNQGWTVIGHLMQYERGTYGWPRQARLHNRVDDLVAAAGPALASDPRRLGETCLDVIALRLKCRRSLRQLADSGAGPGASASVDKLLLVRAETAVAELAHEACFPDVELGEDDVARGWRYNYLYARALAVFGGTNEVQRNIVAERLLRLPRG